MTRQSELNLALESMHFGFRAMTFKPDQRLAQLGLSRIHHRLLYFVARDPSCSVNELLQTMHITKQYLHRPLRQMIDLNYIKQSTDSNDGRTRRLALTAKGKKLESRHHTTKLFLPPSPQSIRREKHNTDLYRLFKNRVC